MKAAAVFSLDAEITKEQEEISSWVPAMEIFKSFKPAGPSEKVASLAVHLTVVPEHLLCAEPWRGKMKKTGFLSSWSKPKLCHAPNWDVITAMVSASRCPRPPPPR